MIYAVLPDGQTEELATGRALDLDQVHSEMEQARSGLAVQLDTLTHTTSDFLRREHELLLNGRGLPGADHPDRRPPGRRRRLPPTTPTCRRSARSSASRHRWSSPSAPPPTTCSA